METAETVDPILTVNISETDPEMIITTIHIITSLIRGNRRL